MPTMTHEDCSDCRRRARRKANRSRPELADKVKSLTRQLRGLATSSTQLGEFAGPEDVALMAALVSEADAVLTTFVSHLLTQGYSWADVGRALGMSKQGAQQRFARRLNRSEH